nr:MAG TPA: hypothetical protein [Caudoviricetes sp.]DAS73751.1 MAG TPA: hypothetical protein [Caudoviricetes sp.]
MQHKYKKKVKIVAFMLDLCFGTVYYNRSRNATKQSLGGEQIGLE